MRSTERMVSPEDTTAVRELLEAINEPDGAEQGCARLDGLTLGEILDG